MSEEQAAMVAGALLDAVRQRDSGAVRSPG